MRRDCAAQRCRRGVRLGCAALLATSVALGTGRVHAYRNPERFTTDVMEGGGGGKYFTGSRAEGYTCDVCHTPGTPPALQILGAPAGDYQPGQSYHITIDWPDALGAVALNFELTDASGAPLGELTAPASNEASPADLCTAETLQGESGSSIVTTPAGRRIVTVIGCGQHQTSFDWRAPGAAAGVPSHGWLTGSVLVSNNNGKVTGDSVANFSRPVNAAGAGQALAADLTGSCSVLDAGRGARSTAPWFTLTCVLAMWRLVRVRRRARP